MRLALSALAVFAATASTSAWAGVGDSDLWIGFEDQENGFLLDEDTGDVWMTGLCLKPLSRAEQNGRIWISQTVELVSVGRAMAVLDQTFELDTAPARPSVKVSSGGRGGVQQFPAILDKNCTAGGTCARLIASQKLCQD